MEFSDDSGSDSGFEEVSPGQEIVGEDIEDKKKEEEQTPEEQVNPDFAMDSVPMPQAELSLEADMVFGWKPDGIEQGAPIPFEFDLEYLPARQRLDWLKTAPTVFNSVHPHDSLVLHQNFSGDTSYPFSMNPRLITAYEYLSKQNKKAETRDFVGMNPKYVDKELNFNSNFESGNLDKVTLVKENEYDLYMRHDTNSKGHNQWFYFQVSNIKQPRRVKFNIVNFTKKHSLYEHNMLIWIYSINKWMRQKEKGWFRGGEEIKYERSPINQYHRLRKFFYCLSFEYTFDDPEDTLYFAYSVPYTFSKLHSFIQRMSYRSHAIRVSSLCNSLSGIDVPLLIITDFSDDNWEKKQHVIFTARVHPGETNSSWIMQGLIRFLVGPSPKANELRRNLVFKIVPMLNPDGVIVGNYRSSFAGNDLNRTFLKPDSRLHPTVNAIKQLIAAIIPNTQILAYIDIHGHSRKKSFFMYGPRYSLHHKNYYKQRVIPKLLHDKTEMFRYYSWRFRWEKDKARTARLVIWKEFNIMNTFTLEASFLGWFNAERITHNFDEKIFKQIGEIFGSVLGTYRRLLEDEERDRIEKRELRMLKRNRKLSSAQYFQLLKEREERKSSQNTTQSEGKTGVPRRRRTMNDVINSIKEDLKEENRSSSSSLSEEEDYEQPEEDQMRMHNNILSALDDFKKYTTGKSEARYVPYSTKQLKAPIVKNNELEKRSSLTKYFTRASTSQRVTRKKKKTKRRFQAPLPPSSKMRSNAETPEHMQPRSYSPQKRSTNMSFVCRRGLKPPGLEMMSISSSKSLAKQEVIQVSGSHYEPKEKDYVSEFKQKEFIHYRFDSLNQQKQSMPGIPNRITQRMNNLLSQQRIRNVSSSTSEDEDINLSFREYKEGNQNRRRRRFQQDERLKSILQINRFSQDISRRPGTEHKHYKKKNPILPLRIEKK